MESDYLQKEGWLKLYDLCSAILHVWNPYTGKEKQIKFEKNVSAWVVSIQKLLAMHYVYLLDNCGVWLITMGKDGEKVRSVIAEPRD